MVHIDKLLGRIAPNRQAASTAPEAKCVVVFDAHTEQGRSVCEILIKDNSWIVWGLVPDRTMPEAVSLANMQVKLIVGALETPRSYEHFLKDKDGVFLHVDFDRFHRQLGDVAAAVQEEMRHTKTAIDACVAANVKHLVYSALDDLPSDQNVPHCYAKSQMVKYIQSTNLPTTFLYTSTPFSSILYNNAIKPPKPASEGIQNGNGTAEGWVLDIPVPDDCALPGYPAEQTGEWVKMALAKPKLWIGKDMQACTEHITPVSMVKDLHHVYKVDIVTRDLTREAFYRSEHKKLVGEVAWSHYKAFYEGHVKRDPTHSETIVPTQWSFKQWAKQSAQLKKIFEEQQSNGAAH